MSEVDWRDLDGAWERLRWARMRKFETAQAAAESMGMRPNTYTAFERRPDSSKHTVIGHQAAIRFSRKFGVRWEWLLTGEGEPVARPDDDDNDPTPAMRRAQRVMRGLPIDQQEVIATAIEALAKTANKAR